MIRMNFWYLMLWVTILSAFGCSENIKMADTSSAPYKVYKPEVTDTLVFFDYIADIHALRHVEIRPRVTGFVNRYYVDEGARVNKGDLIVRINSQEFEQQILRATASLKSVEAELKAKEYALEKTKELFEKNIVSFAEVTVAQAATDAAIAAVELAKSELKMAQLNLSYTEIRAPFGGFINNISHRSGSLVDEEDVLTTLSRTDSVHVYFNVSEKEYLEMHADLEIYEIPVRLTLADGSVFPFSGKVEIIEGIIDRFSGGLSFRAKFPNPDFKLKHGGSGIVALSRKLNEAILIASKSVFEVQSKKAVYVVDENGKIEIREIKSNYGLNKLLSVSQGIHPSDQILYEGIQLVKVGDSLNFKEVPLFQLIQE
jgi:membrane fusion protein, multidrug efflux system